MAGADPPLREQDVYILKTPKTVSGIGAFSAAGSPSQHPSGVERVDVPSSHIRAVE
jgi:hypothetical protein